MIEADNNRYITIQSNILQLYSANLLTVCVRHLGHGILLCSERNTILTDDYVS